jgi:hypothetical protein
MRVGMLGAKEDVRPCLLVAGGQSGPNGPDHLSYRSRDRRRSLRDGSEEEPAGGIGET